MTVYKILHVTHSFWPATYFGGPIFSTLGLCQSLARRADVSLRVVSTDAAGPSVSERLKIESNPTLYPPGYYVYFSKQLMHNVAPAQIISIIEHIRWADYILLTGTYSFHVLPTLILSRILNKPLVWSPRGALLDSYRWRSHRKPRIKLVYEWLCRFAAGANVTFAVTSDVEAEAVRNRIPGHQISVINNAVEIPQLNSPRRARPAGNLRLLSLGRLDPKKALENLISAVSLLPSHINLGIYGVGSIEYERSLRALARKLHVDDRVLFHGHVDGKERLLAFADSDIFLLPSHSENFGMVIAEALAHGTPVIVSKGAPWAEVRTRGVGLWVDNSPRALADAILEMEKADLIEMGQRGRDWMMKDFSWDARAEEFVQLLRSSLIANDGTR